MQLDVSFFFSLPEHFEFFTIFSYCLVFTFCQVCLLVKETAEIEAGMAEKSSWDQANMRQKLGLIRRNRKKISQIIKDYFYLLFFLLKVHKIENLFDSDFGICVISLLVMSKY